MTKLIRIENADTSEHKVQVLEVTKNSLGPDNIVGPHKLYTPCSMKEFHIHKGKYLIIEEVDTETE